MKRSGFLLFFLLLLIVLAGCRSHHADTSSVARVRIVDAHPGPSRLEFALNGHGIWKHVEYKGNSTYVDLPPGHYSLRVRQESEPLGADEVSGSMEARSAYTVLALPKSGAHAEVALKVIRDTDDVDRPKDRATLRFIAAASEYPKVSLALDNVIAADGQRYASESKPLDLARGDYDLKLWTPNDRAVFGPSPAHFDAGKSYTAVAMGRGVDGSLTLQVYEDR